MCIRDSTQIVVLPGVVDPVHDPDDSLAQDLDAAGSAEGLEPGGGAVVLLLGVLVREESVMTATENHRVQDSVSEAAERPEMRKMRII